MIEFVCEGCGLRVVQVIPQEIPPHGLCACCAWICEHIPGPQGMLAYDVANHRKKENTP